MLVTEYLKNINFKLPRIYLMDCTLNDCSLILKSMTQVLLWIMNQHFFNDLFNYMLTTVLFSLWAVNRKYLEAVDCSQMLINLFLDFSSRCLYNCLNQGLDLTFFSFWLLVCENLLQIPLLSSWSLIISQAFDATPIIFFFHHWHTHGNFRLL